MYAFPLALLNLSVLLSGRNITITVSHKWHSSRMIYFTAAQYASCSVDFQYIHASECPCHVSSCFQYLPPEMRSDQEAGNKLDLNKVVCAAPMLGLHDDDFLYMMSKLRLEDPKAWLFAVDPKKNFDDQGRGVPALHYRRKK